MTVTLDLTPDVEQAIARKAYALGISSSEYLRRMAEKAARPSSPAAVRGTSKTGADHPNTGAEVLAELRSLNLPKGYGDPTIDSPELARQLRAEFANCDHGRRSGAQ